MHRVVLVVVTALVLVSGAGGCSPPCDTAHDDPVTFSKGQAYADGSWESSPWEGPYLHFPSGRRYRLEHGLGKTPLAVHTYLAFDQYPLPGSNASESAGNQAVIERVDDSVIQVRNDTCAEFWLRVVALGTASAAPNDAGTD